MPTRRGPVELGVRRDLARLDKPARTSGLAATALRLAVLLDGELVTERDAAAVAAQMIRALEALSKLRPAISQEDPVDELRARRAARRPDRRAAP